MAIAELGLCQQAGGIMCFYFLPVVGHGAPWRRRALATSRFSPWSSAANSRGV